MVLQTNMEMHRYFHIVFNIFIISMIVYHHMAMYHHVTMYCMK